VLCILLWAHFSLLWHSYGYETAGCISHVRQSYSVCKGLHGAYKLIFRYEYPELSVKSHMHIRADVPETASLFRHLQ